MRAILTWIVKNNKPIKSETHKIKIWIFLYRTKLLNPEKRKALAIKIFLHVAKQLKSIIDISKQIKIKSKYKITQKNYKRFAQKNVSFFCCFV